MMAENKSLLMMVLVCFLLIISIVGLVLGIVSLNRTGSGGNPSEINIYNQANSGASTAAADKVWTFAIGHLQNNIEYLDPVTYQTKGYTPDVIEAVCDIANKNCELVVDIYSNCWNSQTGQRARGGDGLMSEWYDACAGWAQSYNRLLTFGFSVPIRKVDAVAFYVRNDSTIVYTNITGRSFGFIDGWFTNEHCVARYGQDGISGVDLSNNQITHFPSAQLLEAAVNDGTVEIAFTTVGTEPSLKRITPDSFPTRCVAAGPSMMTQKRNTEFVQWWDEAFNRLIRTQRYNDICQNVLNEHAGYPGYAPEDLCIGF